MKLNASIELKSRLAHAAENGSVIAADILTEIKRNADVAEIIRGSYNFFSTKRKRSNMENYQRIRIMVTACNKDLANENFPDRNNPQAPWFPENRADLEPSKFVRLFRNLPEYSDNDLAYFASAICIDSKVTVRLFEGVQDFFEAYNGENYGHTADSSESCLHNSCMRHEGTARNAADFYVNFAGAKILVARDSGNNVLGRAVVWKNVKSLSEDTPAAGLTMLDRVYYTHSFVAEMMREHARSLGITLRKAYNDFSHTKEVTALNDDVDSEIRRGNPYYLRLAVEVPAHKWHKKGAPYMDTFFSVHLDRDGMELRNFDSVEAIATLRNTSGSATRMRMICPNCGSVHNLTDNAFCPACRRLLYQHTEFGDVMRSGVVEYGGRAYPSVLFKKKRPKPAMRLYLQVDKLYMA